MRPLFSRPAVAAGFLAVTVLAGGGCAATIRTIVPAGDGAERVAVAYVPVSEGLRVKVANLGRSGQLFGVGYGDLAGLGFDVLAGINVPLFLLSYGDGASAVLTSALLAGALVGGDLALSPKVWAKAFARPTWVLRLGAGGAAGRDVALRPEGSPGDLAATVPLTATERTAPLSVAVIDEAGRVLFSEIKQFPDLAWGGASPVAVARGEERQDGPVDVDDPPPARAPDRHAAAVIVGIERYGDRIPGVPWAERDALVFRQYAQNVLRVPEENIIYLANDKATKGAIETAIEAQLPTIVAPGKSDVYVYYAGHGAPEVEKKAPYLVPYDGNPDFPGKSCYALDALYAAVGKLEARSVTVILDACFTGSAGRTDTPVGLFADARPLFVAPIMGSLPHGVAVLAASSGTQLSSGYAAKGHGLFTYFLLKGLQGEAYGPDGKLTLLTLHRYLGEEVPARARRLGRAQTPVLLGEGVERVLAGR